MRWPQIQRTERTPLVVPTPRIAPVIAWVVEIGMPEVRRGDDRGRGGGLGAEAADGLQARDAEPIVFTIRHPPNIVPSAIATWQMRMIHHATVCVVAEDVEGVEPVLSGSGCVQCFSARRRSSSMTMMPIVFCASLPPWLRL